MDTTPSGIDSARRFGRHEITSCAAKPSILLVALLVVAITLGARFVAAQDADSETSAMAPLASTSLLLDAVAVDGRLVVVGERGHILISEDDGASWRQVEAPTRAMLTAVTFVNNDVGLAVGHDSVILRTTDGGESWERVHWAPEDEAPFFDVWFADATHGVAIGAYGSHFVSADAGATWEFEPLGDTDWHLHQIARADDGEFFVAAEAGFVYHSDDEGATWNELPSPYEGSFFGVLPLDEESVLLFGLRGHLFRSDDAGETWSEIETGTVAMLNRGVVLDDGTVVIVGLGGTVLISNDAGHSFSNYRQAGRRGISSITATGSGALVLVGEFGVRTATLAELTASVEGDDQ